VCDEEELGQQEGVGEQVAGQQVDLQVAVLQQAKGQE